jgi:pyruvate/2-oxoglutarate dehydrogenase complex dihydrolipoamide dehydrogenase (E3) component
VPPVDGLDSIDAWTPRDATSAKEPPARLLVLGGGYVGCEMATAWQALGSQVTIFQRGERLLEGLEPAAGEAVEASLRARGVEVHTDCEITAARRDGADVVATTSHGDLRSDELLVAVGRRARTREIGLDTVGLEPGRYLDVDDTMQVRGVPWLYGVGDVTGGGS